MKILIISTNAIGDTFLSASLIKPLQEKFGTVEFHFLISNPMNFLMSEMSFVTSHVLRRKSAIHIMSLARSIRKREFDIAFSLFPGRVNTLFLRCSRSRVKIGFENYYSMNEWHDVPHRLTVRGLKAPILEWKPEMTFLDRVRFSLLPLGITESTISKFTFDSINLTSVRSRETIVIHPFSLRREKSLSTDAIVGLVHALRQQMQCKVILIGSTEDRSRTSDVSARIPSILTELQHDLPALASILFNSKIFIAVDSFPLHLADAYDLPFVGLFAPTNPHSVLMHHERSIRFDAQSLCDVPADVIIQKLDDFLKLQELNKEGM